MLEQSLSEELEELIAAKLGDPTARPPRRPDPQRRSEVAEPETHSLDTLAPGVRGVSYAYRTPIPRCSGISRSRHLPGDTLEVLDRQPFDGPLYRQRRRASACARRDARTRHPRVVPRARGRAGKRGGDDLPRSGDTLALAAGAPAPSRVPASDGLPEPAAERSRLPAARGRLAGDVAVLGPGVRGVGRLRRSGQLRNEHPGRRPLRLPVAVGSPRGQPRRDAHPVSVGEARRRHGLSLPSCAGSAIRLAPWGLWVQAELVAMSTDVAEFLGAALGLTSFPHPAPRCGGYDGRHRFRRPRAAPPRLRRFEIAITALLALVLFGFLYEILAIGPSRPLRCAGSSRSSPDAGACTSPSGSSARP